MRQLLDENLQLHGSLYEHLDTGHERTDLGETAATDDVSVVCKCRLVVVLSDTLHYLMQPG